MSERTDLGRIMRDGFTACHDWDDIADAVLAAGYSRAAQAVKVAAGGAPPLTPEGIDARLAACGWDRPVQHGATFTLWDDGNPHGNVYLVCPGGTMVPFGSCEGDIDEQRVRFIMDACNAVLGAKAAQSRGAAPSPTPEGLDERHALKAVMLGAFGPQCVEVEPVLVVSAQKSWEMDTRVRLYAGGDGITMMLADAILAAGYRRPPQADAAANLARAAHSLAPDGTNAERIDAAEAVVAAALAFYETTEHGERSTGRRYNEDREAVFAAAKAYADAHAIPARMERANQSRGAAPSPTSEWIGALDRLAAIIDTDAFDGPGNEFAVERAVRRNAAREKVRLIENALVAAGWQTNTDAARAAKAAQSRGAAPSPTPEGQETVREWSLRHELAASQQRVAALEAMLAKPSAKPEGTTVDRATAERAADHLDAEADCLRDSHTIRGSWSETPDAAEREAKADHDSMRACAAALRAKP